MLTYKYVLMIISFLIFYSFSDAAHSQSDFPDRNMTYIVPFNAGGESDISARFQQSKWQEITGQNLVIKYQTGAGGAVAWSQLNGIEGDGYTVMGINLPHTILQPFFSKMGYQTDDLTPVHYFHYTPNAIIVRAKSPFKKIQDLIDYAQKNPGILTFAGSGSKSANHLGQLKFDIETGVKTTYIPFSGTGSAMTAILGGQVVAGFNYVTAGVSQGNAVRILAVASEERMASFPNVPTFKESGIDIVGGAYRGVAVPASTSEARRQEISNIIAKINKNPDFVKKMEQGGYVLTHITYDEMPAFIAKMKLRYSKYIKIFKSKKEGRGLWKFFNIF